MIDILIFLLLLPIIIPVLATIVSIIVVKIYTKYSVEEKIISTPPFAEPEYKDEEDKGEI